MKTQQYKGFSIIQCKNEINHVTARMKDEDGTDIELTAESIEAIKLIIDKLKG